MRGQWAGSLGVALGLLWGNARAEDSWRPAQATGPAVTLGRPIPAVSLGRPVAMRGDTFVDAALTPAEFSPTLPGSPGLVVRGQLPEANPPAPPPPPAVPPPVGANERFNCGVVTENPNAGRGVLGGLPDKIGGLLTGVGGNAGNAGNAGNRGAFQSDHEFDGFASPVTNPFLFEDPRALTEVRPLFMYQSAPLSNWLYHGGDIEYVGLQARLAVTDWLSFVMSEVGLVWMEPHNGFLDPADHVASHDGFTELRLGPKFTFFRCDSTQTVAAAGLNFDIPVGDAKVFQNTGTLSLEPYISVAQNFGKSSYGSFNVMDTIGYNVAVDNKRTDFLFNSLHLDFDIANTHLIYPFIEANWFYVTAAGTATNVGFEGRDLVNFGSMGVSGNNTTTLATGFRFNITRCLQTGIAYELPIGEHRDLIDYRFTVDVIFRY